MNKVIGYARVSTKNQQLDSTIDLQVFALKEYCNERGLLLENIFTDEAISGATELSERPGLIGLFSYLNSHTDIKEVIVFKLDRLSRGLILQEQLITHFQKLEVRIVSIKEQDINGNDPSRTFVRQVFGAVSQLEKSLVLMRLDAGRRTKAHKGGYSGGRIPYGYIESNNKQEDLTINHDEAEVVKNIFQLKKQKKSIREITRLLNNNNISSPRGSKWYPSSVKYILDNSIYLGKLVYTDIVSERSDLRLVS